LEDGILLWEQKILPKITYAAPAWFMYDAQGEYPVPFRLGSDAIKKLRAIQDHCLTELSGARPNTDRFALLALFHDVDIVHRLYAMAMTHRSRSERSKHYLDMEQARVARFSDRKGKAHELNGKHPQRYLTMLAHYVITRDFRKWAHDDLGMEEDEFNALTARGPLDNMQLQRMYKQFWQFTAFTLTEADFYRRRIERKTTIAHRDDVIFQTEWVDDIRSRFAGLTRAQSTMAVYIMTANIPLASNPRWRHGQALPSEDCPLCEGSPHEGKHRHTGSHLFFYCPALSEQREWLFEAIGCTHKDLKRLMRDNLVAATCYGIQFFRIEMFKDVKLAPHHVFPGFRLDDPSQSESVGSKENKQPRKGPKKGSKKPTEWEDPVVERSIDGMHGM
jgi:hypothetical protein